MGQHYSNVYIYIYIYIYTNNVQDLLLARARYVTLDYTTQAIITFRQIQYHSLADTEL